MTSLPSTLLLIDSKVHHYESLIRNLRPGTDVVVLDSAQDGINQITQTLQHYTALTSLHVLSHGAAGAVHLGNAPVTSEVLERNQDQLASWSNALTETASILLYGCEVAAGEQGAGFIQKLAQLTGANVAASTNLTGCAALGGDWVLEASTGPIETTSIFDSAALEDYPFVLADLVLEEDFKDDTVEGAWITGTLQGDQTNPFLYPYLTARDGSNDFPPGSIPNTVKGAPGGAIDRVGEGAFRLTGRSGADQTSSLNKNQSTFLIYNIALPANAGLDVTFNFFAYGSDTSQNSQLQGADGISFFLIDGSASPTTSGSFGGSLGYAPRLNLPNDPSNPSDPGDGLVGGYLGIGFDAFGNFASPNDFAGQETVRNGGPGRRPDSVTLRGPGSQRDGYEYITHTSLSQLGPDLSIDNASAQTRDAALRTARIRLLPNGRLTVTIDFNGRENPGQEFEVINIPNIAERLGQSIPTTFKFGFAGATGSFTNIHEINTLEIRQAARPPIAQDVAVTVSATTAIALTGNNALSAIDPDGEPIVNFIIKTLPSQGQLFLGDPSAGGSPITSLPPGGRVLTPALAAQLFYQPPNSGFTGARFEYTATDEEGATDPTNGIVAFVLPNNNPPVAQPSTIQAQERQTVQVTGIAATDPDVGDAIAFFTIVSLPNPNQGVLLIEEAGITRLVLQGERLTPTELSRLFFRARPGFTGASFNYTATDGRGAFSAAATVTVVAEGSDDSGCKPGRTIIGTPNADNLVGTPDIDTIRGLGGNDTIRGGNCGDLILGDAGNDTLFGEGGRDRIFGGVGNDVIRGGDGNDVLRGGIGNDQIFGDAGDDNIRGGQGDDVIQGGTGNDLIQGFEDADRLFGGDGNDTLLGGDGNDTLEGNAGNDLLDGSVGNDVLRGGDGNDILRGGIGNDRIFGDAGDDDIRGGQGDDIIQGGAGNDLIQGFEDADSLFGGDGNDTLLGGDGNDTLEGNGGNDLLDGAASNDVLRGGDGNDVLRGGIGNDQIFGDDGDDDIRGGRGNDVIQGGAGDDLIQGLEDADRLFGGSGNDRLFGGTGDDILNGGAGRDELTGGAGADRFDFTGASRTALVSGSSVNAPDRVTDFNAQQGDRFNVRIQNVPVLIRGLFNAGLVVGNTLTEAAIAAYADKNQVNPGAQALRVDEAVFFRWQGGTYLSVNGNTAAFDASDDLVINVTGITFRGNDANAGALTVSNYFVTS
ncbi:MAG TPA: DUF4347 domain-containing protein [Synechococcales cyanobacterium M55_K2018_004]|nr:DUF4347 domain-containing protein [Synechococcales cyanobacterium M55_K2018_004]